MAELTPNPTMAAELLTGERLELSGPRQFVHGPYRLGGDWQVFWTSEGCEFITVWATSLTGSYERYLIMAEAAVDAAGSHVVSGLPADDYGINFSQDCRSGSFGIALVPATPEPVATPLSTPATTPEAATTTPRPTLAAEPRIAHVAVAESPIADTDMPDSMTVVLEPTAEPVDAGEAEASTGIHTSAPFLSGLLSLSLVMFFGWRRRRS
jgi:LPXTG-motif cell wall-anchored protein